MTTYRVTVNGQTRLTFSADFAQASSPILLSGDSTPFQVADTRHRSGLAAELLINWTRSEGGEAVGEDEEWECEEIGRWDSEDSLESHYGLS